MRFLGFHEQGKRFATFKKTEDGILMRRIQQLFILQTVVLCLGRDESLMAHWLDTTGQFSADRARNILDAQGIDDKVQLIPRPLPLLQPDCYRDRKPPSHDFKYRSVSKLLRYLTC